MRLNRLRILIAFGFILFFSFTSRSQSCIPTGIEGTIINLNCNQVCSTLVFPVPHIKSTDDYAIVNVPYNPYPYNTPSGSEDLNLYQDDEFSFLVTLPFNFCFYGATYPTTVVGSNGILTFDPANASCQNGWQIITTIPSAVGSLCGALNYPRASIMGAYSDLDPRTSPPASPPDRKIQWEVFGTAPCRKFVVSYYHIGVFGVTTASCPVPQNTFQIVIHESTGIIEIFTEQKACASTTNPPGLGIQGIQNWNRDAARAVTGRNNTFWTDNNSGYQFVPSGGLSRYAISEMLDMSGNVVATADTLTTVPGLLDIRFPNFCAPAGSTQYVVRTQFTACDNPGNMLISLDTITINRTNNLNATATATVASCGPPDGTITVTVPAGVGTPPYTYVLDGGAPVVGPSPYTFTNVAPGPHTIVVTDASGGCTTTINITVNQSGTIPVTHTTTPTACFGSNTGLITITTAGGTGPYTFSLDGAPPVAGTIPFTFNNVAAGLHTVIVNDIGSGCNSGPISVNVATGAGVSGTATATATACPGVNSGTITVTALTGTAPFTWSLDGGPFLPGASPYTFTNVFGGTHNVTIRDNFNCTVLIPNINVPFGPGVTGNAVPTATSCAGTNDGTITVTALTGTAPFTWSIDGGPALPGASPYTFTNVSPGLHNITIVDNLNCSILIPVNVAAGPTPTGTVTSTATSCSGVNDGTITVTAASMPGPYTFSLDGGAPVGGTIPFTFNNVSAGAHNVVITGAAGCATSPLPVTVTAGTGVTGSATTSTTSCPGATNGTITVTALTGTAPFTWSLDGGAPVTGASPYTFSNVAAGNHTVLVTDAAGCTLLIDPIVVTAGPNLTASGVGLATTCSGNSDGSIIVTALSGTAPYTFSLNGGPPQSGPSPFTFNNLAAGTYTVLVTDAAGCQTNPPVTVVVDPGPVLTTTVNKTDVLCNGGNTGTITVTQPVTGLPPYEYSLDGTNWQLSNTFGGLVANTYTVYYRENGGCVGNQPVTINEPAVLAGTQTHTDAICNGQPDGTVTITPTGGAGPYQYSIDGGANWQSSNIFNGLGANNYTVMVRDVNGCTTTVSFTIQEPTALTASSVNTDATCNGGADGTITITATGGNPGGYQYSIDGTNFQASNVFTVIPGNYTVTVRDNQGCSTTFPVVIGLNTNLTFTPMTDPTICEGSSTTLNFVSNATSWTWTPATGLSDPTIANPVANPTTTTQYTVVATLGLCSATDVVDVIVNPAPIPDAGAPGFICYGQTYQLGGSGGVQYSWTPASFLDNPSAPNPTSSPNKTITYTLSIVADANGCPSLTTDDVTVDVTPPIKIYTFPSDTIVYPGDKVQFKAVSAVPSANIFNWTPNFNMNDATIFNPEVTAMNVGDSIIYKVTASSTAGCIGEAFVRFRVYKGPELYVPTAFTPNGDGLNDRFYPFPVGIKSINYFRVYNRWGQLIFSSNTLYRGWDGKFQGTDQASGVYVWMAQGIDKNNKVITKQGTVTVIR